MGGCFCLDGWAKGRIVFSHSSLGRGVGRLCWRMYRKMVRSCLGVWGDTRTQVRHRAGRLGSVLEGSTQPWGLGFRFAACLNPVPSPGHALEAGWFLLRHAIRKGDPELRSHVINKFLLLPFRSGWDPDHGGLFYFQDADGLCPTQVGMCPGPCGTGLSKAFSPGR